MAATPSSSLSLDEERYKLRCLYAAEALNDEEAVERLQRHPIPEALIPELPDLRAEVQAEVKAEALRIDDELNKQIEFYLTADARTLANWVPAKTDPGMYPSLVRFKKAMEQVKLDTDFRLNNSPAIERASASWRRLTRSGSPRSSASRIAVAASRRAGRARRRRSRPEQEAAANATDWGESFRRQPLARPRPPVPPRQRERPRRGARPMRSARPTKPWRRVRKSVGRCGSEDRVAPGPTSSHRSGGSGGVVRRGRTRRHGRAQRRRR